MNAIQLVQHGFFWGLIFGAVFCVVTLVIGRVNVEMLLNDYPQRHHYEKAKKLHASASLRLVFGHDAH